MMNFLAKSLVLVHTTLSVGAMAWAIMLVIQARDFGRIEPSKEVFEYTADGKEKLAVRHASEYDKSHAALVEAGKTRNRTYSYVKPAIDSIRTAEPYLPNNTLFYQAELERLRKSPDKIEVKRLKEGGNILDTPGSPLGKPVPEDKALDTITKSQLIYQGDLKKLFEEIDTVELDIRKIVNTTKAITAELTGTDETNTYVQPGLYQLTDLEFKAQSELKIEIEAIKPFWSKAVEQSRLYQYRRYDLEETLNKLQGPTPKKS